jgi:hypothetical protein
MFNFDFSETKRFAEAFKKKQKEFDDFLRGFLLRIAEEIVALARQRTPVDTGALRAMWGIGEARIAEIGSITNRQWQSSNLNLEGDGVTVERVSVNGRNFEILIFNAMEYATHIEFGTSRGIKAHYMITVPMNVVENEIPDRFKQAFAEWLGDL